MKDLIEKIDTCDAKELIKKVGETYGTKNVIQMVDATCRWLMLIVMFLFLDMDNRDHISSLAIPICYKLKYILKSQETN